MNARKGLKYQSNDFCVTFLLFLQKIRPYRLVHNDDVNHMLADASHESSVADDSQVITSII